jgi:hypothetical protein
MSSVSSVQHLKSSASAQRKVSIGTRLVVALFLIISRFSSNVVISLINLVPWHPNINSTKPSLETTRPC